MDSRQYMDVARLEGYNIEFAGEGHEARVTIKGHGFTNWMTPWQAMKQLEMLGSAILSDAVRAMSDKHWKGMWIEDNYPEYYEQWLSENFPDETN